MFETVETVKGWKIERVVGTRSRYYVYIAVDMYVTFKTIKAATEFCEKCLEPTTHTYH